MAGVPPKQGIVRQGDTSTNLSHSQVDEAVLAIINDMVHCRWSAGRSHRQYMTKYGVGAVAVRHWAAQAGRFIRLCAGQEDEIIGRLHASLEHVMELALIPDEKGRKDLRSFLGAVELMGRVHGVFQAREIRADPRVEISIDELRDLLDEAGYTVTEKPRTQ